MKKLKLILKDNKGMSELFTSLIGLFVITAMLVISMTFIRVVNRQAVLNEFANQMIITVCDYGKTTGDEIDDRYEQLVESLQIAPEISYNVNGRVQYGDFIEITAKSDEDINLLGVHIPMNFELKKNGRSDYYWK